MKKIPKSKIKILGYDYKLILSKEIGSDELGRCDYTNQIIYLNAKQGEDSLKDSLLHEIIHAISYLMGLKDEDPEEDFVTRISTGLRSVLIQNRWLVKWCFCSGSLKEDSPD
jgi:hypothetical protein